MRIALETDQDSLRRLTSYGGGYALVPESDAESTASISFLTFQGGAKNRKKYLRSDFFLRPPWSDLTTYVIRHTSIYGNMT
jgi:hypothetical protein